MIDYVACAQAAIKKAPRCIHGLRSEIILDLVDIEATRSDYFWSIPLGDGSLSKEPESETVFYRLGYFKPEDTLVIFAHDSSIESCFPDNANGYVPPVYVEPSSDRYSAMPRATIADDSSYGYNVESSFFDGTSYGHGRDTSPIPVGCKFCNKNKGVYQNVVMSFTYLDDEVESILKKLDF